MVCTGVNDENLVKLINFPFNTCKFYYGVLPSPYSCSFSRNPRRAGFYHRESEMSSQIHILSISEKKKKKIYRKEVSSSPVDAVANYAFWKYTLSLHI